MEPITTSAADSTEAAEPAAGNAGGIGRWVQYIQKDLPEHLHWWPYTLGAIPLTLFGLLVATGLLLTVYYVPSSEGAYASVEQITHRVYLGWFVRGVHKMSVDLMILFLIFHVIRAFLTRAYRPSGELKWVAGALVFFLTLAMGFTGYCLVYDNVSYWGMTVVTGMIGNLPIVGKPLLLLLRGGEDVTGGTLLRLYDLHTKLLPVLLGGLVIAHIVAVRLLGFAEVQGSRKFHPFYPDHMLTMGAIALALLVLIVDLVMIFPPTLGPPADLENVAGDVSPPWYFSAPYMWITILPGVVSLWSMLAGAVLFLVYPYLDGALTRRGWTMGEVNVLVAMVVVALTAILTFLDAQM